MITVTFIEASKFRTNLKRKCLSKSVACVAENFFDTLPKKTPVTNSCELRRPHKFTENKNGAG